MGITLLKLVGGFGMIWAITKTCLEWTGKMHLIRASVSASAAWAVDLYGVLSAPSHPSTVAIFSVSVGLVGLLVYVEKRKVHRCRSQAGSSPIDSRSAQQEPDGRMVSFGSNDAIGRSQVHQEWENLEEGDREIIREIVLKGGLMESDITALLKARGFLQYDNAYEPITHRVNFIHCDYSGYHSIVPACQGSLCEKIREEFRDDGISNERRSQSH